MKKRKPEEEHSNLERWLITYADLITLLLAFFILMYTMSKQDSKKYQEVAAHLRAIFTGSNAVLATGNVAGRAPVELSFKAGAENVASLKEQLEKELREIGDKGTGDTMQKISLISDERGLVVRAMEKAFFDTGKADLTSRARTALDGIEPVLTNMPNHVRVEGHTDNVPINTSEFRSNWELSVRRATEVVRYLVERHGFPPDRISASGYAEYRPIASNDTAEDRAMNRRIEIIIVKTSESQNQSNQPTLPVEPQTGKQ
ncbi:MAG TPA: flagellar motor protein MotB [Syntrophorhabdales bacterium]|nr:flagellar motor protein MotB [Syntrophorhabdales bacterium]